MKLPALLEEIPFKDYLADTFHDEPEPSLQSGTAYALLHTAPAKVWLENQRLNPDYEPKTDDKFSLGNCAHSIFLGVGQNLAVVDAPDWRKSEVKAIRDDANKRGVTPVLRKDYELAEKMAIAAQADFGAHDLIGAALERGIPEVTVLWREAGVLCRCRPDKYDVAKNIVLHYKTTKMSVHESALEHWAKTTGAAFTAAHYKAGPLALTGDVPRQYFLVQEVTPPHLTGIVEVEASWIETAEMARARALTLWGKCNASNNWPRLPSQIVSVGMPGYEETRIIGLKDAVERRLHRPSKAALKRSLELQAP